jgi:hypothetical protein
VAVAVSASMSLNAHYLDFFPIFRLINVVDISLTNTKDGIPAGLEFRSPPDSFVFPNTSTLQQSHSLPVATEPYNVDGSSQPLLARNCDYAKVV